MGLALPWALGPAGELSCPWSSWCVSLLSRGQIGKTGRGRATGLLGPRSPTENSCFVLAGFLPLPFTPEEQTAPESSSLTVANLHCTFRVFVPEPRLKGQRYPGRAVQRTAGARGPGRASPRCRGVGGTLCAGRTWQPVQQLPEQEPRPLVFRGCSVRSAGRGGASPMLESLNE